MKKLLFGLALLFAATQLNAQQYAVRTNTVNIEILGASYSMEIPIAKSTTFTGTIGMMADWNSQDFDETVWRIGPAVAAEIRGYYNLAKRQNSMRDISYNQGESFGLTASYIFQPFYVTEGYIGHQVLTIFPNWGLRRIWGEHFLFEFRGGPLISCQGFETGYVVTTNVKLGINIRLGYVF